MKIQVVFWYPSDLEKYVQKEIEYSDLLQWIAYFNGMGLDVCIPENFLEILTIYVDEKMFKQR